MDTKRLYIKSESLAIDEKEQIVAGVVGSSGIIDRHGESVNPMGWQLANYIKNPVLMYGHDYSSFPIGKALKVWIENNKLMFNLQFAKTEEGQKAFNLIKDGFLNTSSVGFIPQKFGVSGQDPYTIMEQELLELSIVPVPANPEALIHNSAANEMFKSLDSKVKELEKKEEEKSKVKSPECRMEGETKDECVARKIKEIKKDNPEMKEDQVIAMAESMCSKACKKEVNEITVTVKIADAEIVVKTLDQAKELIEKLEKENKELKEGRILSDANRKLISDAITQMKEAIDALDQLMAATEPKKDVKPDEKKVDLKPEEKSIAEGLRDYLRSQNKKTSQKLKELNDILGKTS